MALPELESIKQRRRALGLSQYSLANKAGISQSMLAKIENKRAEPSFRIAKEILETLEELENASSKKAVDVMNRNVISLQETDTVEKAIGLAKKYAVSQFPVVRDGLLVKSISVRELLDIGREARIGMIDGISLPTVNENTPVEAVKSLLKSSQAVLVVESGRIRGIITAEDLL
ncbi:MAG: CBS domain-containing protein [Candidatus Micrarchaeaceae archaeon]